MTADNEPVPDYLSGPIPNDPVGAAIAMTASVRGLREEFIKANRYRDSRDKKRFRIIVLTSIGLVIDIALSVTAFFLLANQHSQQVLIQRQEAVIQKQATEISQQAAEIHQNQIDSCNNSNKTRATASATWNEVLGRFDTSSSSPAQIAVINTLIRNIDQAYKPVDCSKVFKVGG